MQGKHSTNSIFSTPIYPFFFAVLETKLSRWCMGGEHMLYWWIISYLLIYYDNVSCSPGWLGTPYVAGDELESLKLLPPRVLGLQAGTITPSWCSVGLEPKASCLLDKHFANWPTPQSYFIFCLCLLNFYLFLCIMSLWKSEDSVT